MLNMTIAMRNGAPIKSSGRSIVELMIALTIGLVMMLAISALFVANKNSFRAGDDKSRLDEEGRVALNLLAFHVRMAGYGSLSNANSIKVADDPDPANPGQMLINNVTPSICTNFSSETACNTANAIRGCSGKLTTTGSALPSPTAALGCTAGVSHSVIVRYVVDGDNANKNAGVPADCLGAALILDATKGVGGAGAYIAENRFFVANNASGVPELFCQGNGGTAAGAALVNPPQAIAENIEQMTIEYGLSADERSSVASQFVSAAVIEATPASWDRVVLVRICLLARSANDNVATQAQTYTNCQNTQVLATDRRLRNVFSTTITLRSRATGAI
ncbi:MAG: PilW family protein [Undibacterium sp.]|nr:PilW family protein [Undibacterium sp.]